MGEMMKNSYWVFVGNNSDTYIDFIPNKIYIGNMISDNNEKLFLHKNEHGNPIYALKEYFRELKEGECIYYVLKIEKCGLESSETIVSIGTDKETAYNKSLGYVCISKYDGHIIAYDVIKYIVRFNSDKTLLI